MITKFEAGTSDLSLGNWFGKCLLTKQRNQTFFNFLDCWRVVTWRLCHVRHTDPSQWRYDHDIPSQTHWKCYISNFHSWRRSWLIYFNFSLTCLPTWKLELELWRFSFSCLFSFSPHKPHPQSCGTILTIIQIYHQYFYHQLTKLKQENDNILIPELAEHTVNTVVNGHYPQCSSGLSMRSRLHK